MDDVVALLMRQHGEIRNLFDEVERSTGDDRRDAFRRLVRMLALHETAEEESCEFVQLRRRTGAHRLARVAKAVKAAEAMAPTHPHPGVETAAKNIMAGPMAAMIDRTRDTIRKTMGRDG
ncbi:hemerythrin domain-containing protein [Streptomyces melanosporofaciens]|uniref:hemerythrin domain-containing protein n=1 Tax=Streptomyces melanosporofaciens TaxID=67327 RepID=UPI000B83F4F5|nr:hemerythrin domain-containing protein [Streptomyces melanosporofaciens]